MAELVVKLSQQLEFIETQNQNVRIAERRQARESDTERDASPLACHLPGEDGSDRWKPGISDGVRMHGYTDEGKGGVD